MEYAETKLTIVKNKNTEDIPCSNCGKVLMKVFEQDKDSSTLYKVVVNCPFCGDKSFEKEVHGIFRALPGEGVLLSDVVYNGNISKFLTKKAT